MVERKKVRVLFVCMANICRSPTAEGVFRQYAKEGKLADRIDTDSAGTADYHAGEQPDRRACRVASQRGYDLTNLRARQVTEADFAIFDHVLAMDHENMQALITLCPLEHAHKIKLLTDFCSSRDCTIADPYTGSIDDFVQVLDVIENAAEGLLKYVRAELESS